MTFDIIIPWRGGCPYRQLVFDWIVNAHDSFGRNVIIGELEPDEPWVKAHAIRNGLAKSTADVVVISDADVWCGSTELALDHLDGSGWAVPYRDVHRLSPQSTSAALQTGDLSGKLEQRAYLGVPGGGLVVIKREVYDRVPMDPRFVGWGQEDEAWGAALAVLAGSPWRGTVPLYHLWHPPQPRQNRATGSEASRTHRNRYVRARRFVPEMEALVQESISLLNAAV